MKENFKAWFSNLIDKKNKFMALIGIMFTLSFLSLLIYQIVQINYFFGKKRIVLEGYERIITSYFGDIVTLVTIIILFYYKNEKENENN